MPLSAMTERCMRESVRRSVVRACRLRIPLFGRVAEPSGSAAHPSSITQALCDGRIMIWSALDFGPEAAGHISIF